MRVARASTLSFPVAVLLAGLLLWPLAVAAEEETPSQAELDAHFAEMMEGKHLEGEFSVVLPDGASQESPPPQPELYMVSKLEKEQGDTWIFTASMSYGGHESMELPIPVQVLWAGKTPVLTMTDQTIEGLGTAFTARVLVYDGRYAGTWQHGGIGGHMWGLLVEDSSEEAASQSP